MGLPKDLTRSVRNLDRYDLRQLLILVRGLLTNVDGLPDEPRLNGVTYRQEEVSCGREECGTCPHGPYWYAYWREDGRTRSLYIGRRRAGEPLEPVVSGDQRPGSEKPGGEQPGNEQPDDERVGDGRAQTGGR